MRNYFLSVAASVVLVNGLCADMLSDSMAMTEACLDQLEQTRSVMAQAKSMSDENIAAVMDANELLKKENEKLFAENSNLKNEISDYKRQIAISSLPSKAKSQPAGKSISVKKASQDADFLSFYNIEEPSKTVNLGSEMPQEPKQVKTETVKPELRQVKAKNKPLSVTKMGKVHMKSDSLKEKYQNLNQKELMSMGAYKVSVKSIHMRTGHSSKTKPVGYLRRGEIVEIKDVYVNAKNKHIVWAKTDAGWFYVPRRSEQRLLTTLKENVFEKVAMLPSQNGGAKGI